MKWLCAGERFGYIGRTGHKTMNAKQQVGIVLLVAAGVAGFWAYGRYSGFVGQMLSWSPPFSSYETLTIAGGLAALLFLVMGLRMIAGKKKEGSDS